MGDVWRAEAERVVEAVGGVDRADVQLVFDPPWSMDRISEAARLELGRLMWTVPARKERSAR